MEVLPHHQLESIQMARGGIAGLLTGDVEADHPVVAVVEGHLGHVDRARRRAHRSAQQPHGQSGAGRPLGQPLQHGIGRLVHRQAALDAQLRGHPHLCVHHPVGGQVGGALGCDALDRLAPLHQRHHMGKRLQVQAQVTPVGAAVKPLRQLDRVGAGQSVVTGLLGQLDQRARPGATVEVIVQQHLGCGRNRLGGGRGSVQAPGAAQ